MYKYYFREKVGGNALYRHLLKTMKIFLLLLFVHVQLMASSQVVNLREKGVKINVVLKKIQDQTGYSFVITNSILQEVQPKDYEIRNMSLTEALDQITKNQNLSYEISDNVIIINKSKETTSIVATPRAQQVQPVRGRVVDPDGRAIPDATVRIKGSGTSTKTNSQGDFILEVPSYNETLVVTFIGYSPVEIKAAPTLVVSLTPASSEIDEVVAVGYGSMRRRDLTGSIASVDVNEIRNMPFVSIDQALAGKAPGVQVTQADGSPGGVARIRIRGGASLIGGNDPLYIIDGVQVPIQNRYVQAAADIVNPIERLGTDEAQTGATVGSSFARGLNSLAGLNINDIESIDILKDASATAIYGSRAANGVVIITTKKGKLNQKPVLEANYYTGLSNAITEELLTADQYRSVMREGAQNLNDRRQELGLEADALANSILSDPNFLGTANTDWLDLITRTGRTQDLGVSVRGGGTGSRYFTSLSYSDQTGTLVGTDFSRLSGKLSLDNEISRQIRLITNMDYGFTQNNITNGIYSSALFAPPSFAPYAADGSPAIFDQATYGFSPYMGIQNPMALLAGQNTSRNNMLLGSLSLEYTVIPELIFRSTVSANYNNYHQLNYVPSTAMVSSASGADDSAGGIATQGYTNQLDMFYENTLTWDRELDVNNRFNIMAGTTWQQTNGRTFSASGQGFPDDYFLNGLSSAALAMPPQASESQSSLLSFYLRANYAHKERYLLTLTGRSDESSKFPRNNRTGYFPSFGVAWRVSEEPFMRGATWLNELKIRASAGRTGTQNLGDHLFYTLFTPGSYASKNALIPTQLGNDRIKWETTVQRDAGIDFALFGSRLRGAFGYYEKNTSDLLMSLNTALSSGFGSALVNLASINNQGIELDLRGDLISNSNVNWNIAVNVSRNRSTVTKINRDLDDPRGTAESDPFWAQQSMGNSILREGEPIGLIYGYTYTGVIKTQEQLDKYKEESLYAQFGILENLGIGYPMYELETEGAYAGYWKRDVIGHAQPDFYGGVTNSFTYKNFNVIALLTFSKGGDLLYLPDVKAFGLGDRGNRNTRALLPRFSDENPDSDLPRLLLKDTNTYGTGSSSANVFDASYIKLKSISVNYMLPTTWTSNIRVANAMVYVSGSNLLTFTKYPGPDPEVSNDPYSLIGGYTDAATYPSMRQFTFGLRFGF